MTLFKIYFNRQIKENETVTNVTFLRAENIQDATLYALKTFGDNFIEIKTR